MSLFSGLIYQSIHFNLKQYALNGKKISGYDIFLDSIDKKLLKLTINYKDGEKQDITNLYHRDYEIDVDKFEQLFNDNLNKKGFVIKKYVLLRLTPFKCILSTGDNGKDLKNYVL